MTLYSDWYLSMVFLDSGSMINKHTVARSRNQDLPEMLTEKHFDSIKPHGCGLRGWRRTSRTTKTLKTITVDHSLQRSTGTSIPKPPVKPPVLLANQNKQPETLDFQYINQTNHQENHQEPLVFIFQNRNPKTP